LQALAGEPSWLYPQTDVFIDLADARDRDGGDARFGVRDTHVIDVTGDWPGILFTDADDARCEVRCSYLVGADGSRSICRVEIPESVRTYYFREYPFAWFGILADAPKSAPELGLHPLGAGLFADQPAHRDNAADVLPMRPRGRDRRWSEGRIWAELQARVAGPDGFTLREGPITDKAVLRFRSFVAEPMRYGNLLLAGDAAHTVPPTGAKGLNLALADVRVLAEILERAVRRKDADALDEYGPRALGPGLEGAALLLLDDHHAAHPARCHRLRPATAARRTRVCGVLGGWVDVPGRGLPGGRRRRGTGNRSPDGSLTGCRAGQHPHKADAPQTPYASPAPCGLPHSPFQLERSNTRTLPRLESNGLPAGSRPAAHRANPASAPQAGQAPRSPP